MREQWAVFESIALGGERLDVSSLEGTDHLNQLFRFEARIVRTGVLVSAEDAAALLDAPATLRFEEDRRVLQQVHGIVSEVSTRVDVEADSTELTVVIVPRVWRLTQQRGSEIFLARTIPQVIADKLTAIGLVLGVDFTMPLRAQYPVREFVAQHEETDHAFVSRLCEEDGIITFFEHRDGRDVWVLTDTPSTFHRIERPDLPVRTRRVHPAAYEIRTTLRRVPSQAEVLDYNYRTPRIALRRDRPIEKPAARGAWIEYGAHPKTPDETGEVARLRTEELGARHHVVDGKTSEASVRAGGTLRLMDAGGSEQDLLLVGVAFRFRSKGGAPDDEVAWENEITCIPSAITYRPPRVTPWPEIPGLVNGVVDGAIKGDYAELDESGRYHLRMLYDRSGRTNLGATHPVRMMQPHAGANYGMHFPLRPGTEVLVGFVNGDPDRPIIVGSAPNPITVSPVVQPNQTQNVLRTGSNNEMVIEDERGRERIRIHTPHKDTTVQLGSVEEPEEGALTTTQAHISEASRLSNNEATMRKTLMATSQTALIGRSAVIAAGSPAIAAACERGIEQPTSVSVNEVARDLGWLSTPPEQRAEGAPPADQTPEDVSAGGLWSTLAGDVAQRTERAVIDLARAAASTTDEALDRAKGRAQGEPVGQPMEPAAVMASDRTAALIGRDASLVFGDRAAALSSFDTASVVGHKAALLKSPGTVEIAGGKEAKITTAGELDAAAGTIRVVGGYYPDREAPPLDEGTSVGVMSRHDLRVLSVEDCILLCAKKNLIGTAHTGDVRLKAAKTVSITGGSIVGTAGNIKLKASDTIEIDADGNITITSAANIAIEAAGSVVISGAEVTLEAGAITLQGDTKVVGNLTVTKQIIGG